MLNLSQSKCECSDPKKRAFFWVSSIKMLLFSSLLFLCSVVLFLFCCLHECNFELQYAYCCCFRIYFGFAAAVLCRKTTFSILFAYTRFLYDFYSGTQIERTRKRDRAAVYSPCCRLQFHLQ